MRYFNYAVSTRNALAFLLPILGLKLSGSIYNSIGAISSCGPIDVL